MTHNTKFLQSLFAQKRADWANPVSAVPAGTTVHQSPATTPTTSSADSKDKHFHGLELAAPTLLSALIGAGYGAYRAPGKSPMRGAIVGGLAGAGAGAAFTGAHEILASPYGNMTSESPTASTALLLGVAGLGGAGGLRLGREIADRLKLPDGARDRELDELDILSHRRSTLPGGLRTYFGR